MPDIVADGDNLGDHIATRDFNASNYAVNNFSYIESNAVNPATAGEVRLGHGELIGWRDNSNAQNSTIGYGDVYTNTYAVKISGTNEYLLDSSKLDMLNNNIHNVGYQDLTRMSAPADPSANIGRMYVKQIDANNDGLFMKIKQGGNIVEVQIL